MILGSHGAKLQLALNPTDAIMAELGITGGEDAAGEHPSSPVFDVDEAKAFARTQFKEIWPKWILFSKNVKWQDEFPEHEIWKDLPENMKPDVLKHLFYLPVLELCKRLVLARAFGQFPKIGIQCGGGMLASSHMEGVMSAAGDVTEGRLSLSDSNIEMETVLKKNANLNDFLEDEFAQQYQDIKKQGLKIMLDSLNNAPSVATTPTLATLPTAGAVQGVSTPQRQLQPHQL